MKPFGQAWVGTRKADVEQALTRILGSRVFAHSQRHRRLLSYLVTQTLEGHADRLKGYAIATDVFDRGEDFDPAVDCIVRVEAARLRTKLDEYYRGPGNSDAVRISVPKGLYAPAFDFREPAGEAPMDTVAHGTPAQFGDKPSLAVLPFLNMSTEAEQDYFADGITEDLITDLSKLSGLFVIARHSAFAYKGTSKRVEHIGRELGVRYLLEGSVRKSAGRLRISTQLVEAESGATLWAERYDRDLEDVLTVQDEVTHCIVDALKLKLSPIDSQRLGRPGTGTVEAHDAFLRGLQRFWICSPKSNQEARELFTQAVRLDPGYAAAHAWLARSLVFDWAMYWSDNVDQSLHQALKHARRAVECDELLAFGHAILCWVLLWLKDAEGTVQEGEHAVALDPNSADAHAFLSLALASSGRPEKGLEHIEQALRLNPQPPTLYLFAQGLCYLAMEDFESVVGACERGVELNPLFIPNHVYLALGYTMLGAADKARAARDAALRLNEGRRPVMRKPWFTTALAQRLEALLAQAGLD